MVVCLIAKMYKVSELLMFERPIVSYIYFMGMHTSLGRTKSQML